MGHSVHMKEEYENVKNIVKHDQIHQSELGTVCGFQDVSVLAWSTRRVYEVLVFMLSLLME